MDTPKTFPIMAVGGCHAFNLPWALIAPHEAQVVANHGQTLARLAERGGLSAVEAYAAMNGLGLREVRRRQTDAAYSWEWLRSRADDLVAADAEIARLRAELEKWRVAATVLCGEHIGVPQPMCPVCETRDDRERLRVAVDPIRSWYDGDGEIYPPLSDVDMAASAVQDLLADRDELVALHADAANLRAELDAANRERSALNDALNVRRDEASEMLVRIEKERDSARAALSETRSALDAALEAVKLASATAERRLSEVIDLRAALDRERGVKP